MNFIPTADQLKGTWESVAQGAMTFEAPVPDSLLLACFLVALAAQRAAGKRTFARVQSLYHNAYNGELLNANRKAYQARADLDRAQKEIERTRQKERRAKRQIKVAPAQNMAPQPPEDVVVLKNAQRPQPARAPMPQQSAAATARQMDTMEDYDTRQHADAVIQLSENLRQLSLNKGADQ